MKINYLFNQSSLSSYESYLRSSGLSESSIRRKLSSISVFQKYLIKKKAVQPNISIPITSSPTQASSTSKSFLPKSFLKYLFVLFVLVALSGLGFGIYSQTIVKAKKELAYSTAASPTTPGRFLSFQGRLTDSAGNPITSSTSIEFKLYNVGTTGVGTTLYDSWIDYPGGSSIGSSTVTPDANGIFSVIIGKTHGDLIPSSVFTENSEVWLEITAGGETMNPRQQIATVAYALNSESLQGIPPSASGLKNTVLVVDGNGNINLGESNPAIFASSTAPNSVFRIEGQSLLLKATDTYNGDIVLNPDGTGKLKLLTEDTGSTAVGGQIEVTNANLATGNLIAGLIRNDNRGYNFISLQNYNVGTTTLATRFSVDASGVVTVGAGITAPKITLTSGATSGYVLQSDAFGNGSWVTASGIGGTYTAGNGLNLSGSQFKLGGSLTENTRFNIGNTDVMFFNYTNGNVGIGTTAPTSKLHVYGGNIMYGDNSATPTLQLGKDGSAYGLFAMTDQATGDALVSTLTLSASNNNLSNSALIQINSSTYGINLRGGGFTTGGDLNFYTWNGTASSTADTSRLTIKNTTGNIGIGTTSPLSLLDVNGAIALKQDYPLILRRNSGGWAGGIRYDSAGTENLIIATNASSSRIVLANSFDVQTNQGSSGNVPSTSGLVIYQNNVGIGTTTPTASLDVGGFGTVLSGTVAKMLVADNYDGVSGLQMYNSSTGTSADFRFTVADQSKSNYISFMMPSKNNTVGNLFGAARSTSAYIFTNNLAAEADRNLTIGTFNAKDLIFGTNNTDRIHITSTGYIGIGTTAPIYSLQVGGTGSLGVGGTVNFSGLGIGTTGAGSTAVFIDASGNLFKNILGAGAFTNGLGTTYAAINGLTLNGSNQFGLGGTLTSNTNINLSSYGLSFLGLGNTQSLYLASNGNVGIGTTSPVEKLDIAGALRLGINSNTNPGTIRYSSTDSDFQGYDGISWKSLTNVANVSGDRTGFANRTSSTFWFDNASRTFYISPKSPSTSFDYYFRNAKITVGTTQSVTITNTDGTWNFYYDSAGVLTAAQSFPGPKNAVFVADLYWNATAGTSIYLGEERHGLTMDADTHSYLHNTVGTRYFNGLSLSANSAGTGNTDPDAEVAITSGITYDEDIAHNITATTAPVNFFEQNLGLGTGSTVTLPAQIPVYFVGPSGIWRKLTANNFPVIHTATNTRISWNNVGVGTTPIASANNNYIATWLYATNNTSEPIIAIAGQREDTSLANAQTNATLDSLVLTGIPFQEMKILYRVIYQTATTYNNNVDARIVNVLDLRSTSNLPAGTYVATSHSSLTGLLNDDHTQYAILAGRTGGQILYGGIGTSETLTLAGSSFSGGGNLFLNPNGGNVGIGTTNPTQKLDVNGSINLTGTIFSNGTSGSNGQILTSTGTGLQWVNSTSVGQTYSVTNGLSIISTNVFGLGGTLTQNTSIGTSSFGLGIGDAGNSLYKLSVGGTTSLNNLFTSGNVGISTTAPQSKLDIYSPSIPAITWGWGGTRTKVLSSNLVSPWDILSVTSNGASSGWRGAIDLNVTYNGGTDPVTGLTVRANTNGTSANVGIGTTNPTSLFSVGANVGGYSALTVDNSGNLTIGPFNQSTTTPAQLIFGNYQTSGSPRAEFVFNGPSQWMGLGQASTTGNHLRLGPSGGVGTSWPSFGSINFDLTIDGGLSIGTSSYAPTNGMIVLGNVGIGTTNPLSKLDVNGTVNVGSSLVVASTVDLNGLSVSAVGAGSTAVFIDASGNLFKNILGAGAFTNGLGTTYAAGVGLTLNTTNNTFAVDYDATKLALTGNKLTLNLGATNVWTAPTTFTNGLGVSGAVNFTNNLTIGGTFISVGSTNLVTNLNADYLNGRPDTYFVNVGQTGSLPYVNDATNTTLTRSGAGPYTLSLNLGSTNTWTALQTFSSGATISTLTTTGNVGIGGTLNLNSSTIVGTGTTALMIDASGNVSKRALGDLAFQNNTSLGWVAGASSYQSIGTGTTLSFTGLNGITTTSVGTSQITFGLGGTLTTNTNINLSSYGLSFLGLGNTQSLYLASNGNVGIGTTNPITPLHVVSSAGTNNYVRIESGVGTNLRASFDLYGRDSSGNQDRLATQIRPDFNDMVQFVQRGDTTGFVDLYGFSYKLATPIVDFRNNTLTTLGKVGIGTTAPTDKLHVNGAGVVQTRVQSTDNYVVSYLQGGQVGDASWGLFSGYPAAGDFSIRESGVQTSLTIKKTTGNFGIGTTSPGYKLEVVGNVGIGGTLSLTATNVGTGTTALFIDSSGIVTKRALGALAFQDVGGTSYTATNGLTLAGSAFGLGGTLTQNTNIGISSFTLNFVGTTQTTTFASNGYLGLGTSAPTQALHIYKSSGISTIIAETGGSANDEFRIDTKFTATANTTSRIGSIRNNRLISGDTSMYFSVFGGGLKEAMRIRDDGNVGIGTTNPGKKLEIYNVGDTTDTAIKITSGSWFNTITNEGSDGNLVIAADQNQGIRFKNGNGGNTDVMFISSTGYIGIGTTTPNDKLDVFGIIRASSTTALYTQLGNNYIRSNGTQNFFVDNSGTGVDTYFRVSNAGSLDTISMILKSTGKVGIGTTTPTASLDVGGFGTVLSGTVAKMLVADNYDGVSGLQMYNSSTGTSADFRFTVADQSKSNYISFMMPSKNNTVGNLFGAARSTSAYIFTNNLAAEADRNLTIGTFNAKDLIFGTNNTDRIHITSTGYIGIGTTNPNRQIEVNNGSLSVLRIAGNDAILELRDLSSNDQWSIQNADNVTRNLQFRYGAALASNSYSTTDIMTLASSGNVGINTVSPSYKLEVAGDALISTRLGIGSTDANYALHVGGGNVMFDNNLTVGGTVTFTGLPIGTGTSIVYLGAGGNLLSGTLPPGTVYTATNGLTLTGSAFGLGGTLTQNTSIGTSSFNLSFLGLGNTLGLFLSSTGNVGIGTTAPIYSLQVGGTGSLGVGGTVNFSGLGIGTTGAGSTAVFIDASGNLFKNILGAGAFTNGLGTTYAAINGLTLNGSNQFGLGGTLTADTNINLSSYGLSFLGLGNTQSLYLASNGNVGIGTTNPLSKISVVGSISSDNLVLTGNNLLSGVYGFSNYLNSSGGLGTGGLQRLTTDGNLTNISSIQAGQLNITSGGTFGVGTTYSVGATNPYSVTSADVNGDGKPDLITANADSKNITVFTNSGNGTFGTGTTYPTGSSNPYSVTSADVNGDGKPDLITANFNPDSITVFINNGNGTFATGTAYSTTGSNPFSITSADVNGDGKPDLITANQSSGNITVLTNSGNGTFGVGTTYSVGATSPFSVTSADVNGDGKPDLITANYSSHNITVLTNSGNGTFGVGTTYSVGGTNPYSVTSADVNGDGKPDLITANVNSSNITVFTNSGNGTFGVGTTYSVNSTGPFSVTSADVNGDGKPDLITANYSSHNITVLTNSGNGTFGTGTVYSVGGSNPRSVTSADVNGDGKPDLITANQSSGNITVFTNTATTTLFTSTTGNVGIGNTSSAYPLYVGTTGPGGFSIGAIGNITGSRFYDIDTFPNYFLDPANSSSVKNSLSLDMLGSIKYNVGDTGANPIFLITGAAHRMQGFTNGLLLASQTGSVGTTISGGAWDNQLFLNSNGNVGIGTTSPSRVLEVGISTAAGADGGMQIKNLSQGYATTRYQAGTSSLYVGQAAETVNWSNTGTGSAIIQTSGNLVLASPLNNPRLLITSNGYIGIGIGITSPLSILHVGTSTSGNTQMLTLDNYSTDAAGGSFISLRRSYSTAVGTNTTLPAGSFVGAVNFSSWAPGVSDFRAGANIIGIQSSSVSAADTKVGMDLAFYTGIGGTNGATERLRIDSNGNVGIGTTNPTTQLEIGASTASNVGAGLIINQTGTGNDRIGFNFNGTTAYTIGVGGSGSPLNGKLGIGPGLLANAKLIMDSTGNVGIGTSGSPSYRLDVQSSNPGDYVARIKNIGSTATTSSDKGLLITLGNGTSATGNLYYVGFGHGADVITGKIQSVAGGTQVVFTGSGTDYAEWFKNHDNAKTPPGYVMQIATNSDVTRATNGKPIGVISDSASFVGGDGAFCSANDDGSCQEAFNNSHDLVGMIGQIATYISTENGPISAGDPLGPSSIPGVAAKAIKAGYIVGHALQSYNQSGITRISSYINPSWYDPDVQLTSTGQVNINYNVSSDILASLGYSGSLNELQTAQYQLYDSQNNLVTKIGQFAQLAVAKIQSGLITTENLVAQNIIAQITKSKIIKTDTIAPLSDVTGTIVIDGNIKAKEATFSTVYADKVISKEGDFSQVMTNKINSLRTELQSILTSTTTAPESTPSALVAESTFWTADTGTSQVQINGSLSLTDNLVVGAKLTVSGDSLLGNAFITGTFTAGEIAIKDNLIETTNSALYIQPSAIGSVHILGNTLVIADNGDVTITGNLNLTGHLTAQTASVSGSLFANLINAKDLTADKLTTSQLNVATDSATTIIAEPGFAQLATSSAKLSTNATAGTATLPAGKSEIVIYNPKVTPSSMIYLTPNGSTQNQVVYVKNKFITPTPATPVATDSATPAPTPSSFTIALDQPLASDIDINWWIIN